MKNTKNIVYAALFVFGLFAAVPVRAVPLDGLLDASAAAALRNGEKLSEVQFGDPAPRMAPRHEGLRLVIEDIRGALEPGVMAEAVDVYQKPSGAGVWSAEEQRDLFNSVTALSSLKGLQYYSASRGTMRTFYEESSVIDGPSSKKSAADPDYASLPEELTLYARQEDLTFGDNIYQYDYRVFPGAIVFVQQNLTTMKAGIIPAVGKNKLRSVVAVIDAEDCLLVYAVSMVKAAAFPGLKKRIGNSFSTRAEAILTWFGMQADKVYGLESTTPR